MKTGFSLAILPVLLAGWLVAAEPEKRTAPKASTADFVFLGPEQPLIIRLHVRNNRQPVEEEWNQFVDRVFQYLDVNGDGVLDEREANRTPLAQTLFSDLAALIRNQRGAIPASSLMSALDTNRDGKVTRAELAAYYRGNGAGPIQLATGPSSNADALDAVLFQLLDTDRDGKLSREELSAAPAVLARLDANDDEMISLDEILPDAVGSPLDGRLIARTAAPNPNFLVIGPGDSREELARRLRERYGSKVDLGKRPVDLELSVLVGKSRELELLPSKLAGSVMKNEAGAFGLKVGALHFDLRTSETVPGRTTVRAIPSRIRDLFIAQFKTADPENKGYLDRKVAEMHPLFRQVFHLMDRNGDGKLEQKEMLAYFDALEDLQAAARTACVSLTIAETGRGLFDLIDRDRDGRLSVRELRNLSKLLAPGASLTRRDVPRHYSVLLQQGPADGLNLDARARVLAAGRLAVDRQGRTREVEQGPLWFRKMDRNRDGDVSRKEFLGTDEEFKAIDTDGDGLISIEEAERWDKTHRQGERPRGERR
jgi:Ca2+-binding EF-hand superfamily protein